MDQYKVVIRFKDAMGRWVPAAPWSKAALIEYLVEGIGWHFFIKRIAGYCLSQAHESSGDHRVADMWIARYQAIRELANK